MSIIPDVGDDLTYYLRRSAQETVLAINAACDAAAEAHDDLSLLHSKRAIGILAGQFWPCDQHRVTG